MDNKDITLCYMVAGMSKRFNGKIKALAKIGPSNETLLEYSLDQALKSGFSKIVLIVGNATKDSIKEKFKDNYQGIPIKYALQTFDTDSRDGPWGTGDALCSAKEFLDTPFVICNGDDIYGEKSYKKLYEHLQESKEEATLGFRLYDVIPDTGKTHRAIFKVDDKNNVLELIETLNIEKSEIDKRGLSKDDLCSMNIFALHPKTIDLIEKKLQEFKINNKGDRKIEFLLPNELSNLIKENKIKIKLYKSEEDWLGVTNPEDEEIVREKIKQNLALSR
ncbi:MAG: sugar phosphate nucleotidyltransferase [Candidatus Pacearchaeota archaeon]|jgi:NDP-sugar pyrophosphorylase family protein